MEIDHRSIAVMLYNRCWELLDSEPLSPQRGEGGWGKRGSQDEADELERAAFASLYHWSMVGDVKNIAIGEWMVSHAYLALGHLGEAERFASKVIARCEAEGLADFYLAYGYLEMARITRESAASQKWLAMAKAVEIADEEDRAIFESDVAKDGW